MKLQPYNPEAFPRSSGSLGDQSYDGMSLGDYFAAAALPEVIARLPWPYSDVDTGSQEHAEAVAAETYRIAMEMLRERESVAGLMYKAEERFAAMERVFDGISTEAIKGFGEDVIESAHKFVLRLAQSKREP